MNKRPAEPSNAAIRASWRNPANVRLARALFPVISFGTYDPHAAHRWALKLIEADPADGADVTRALVNFDWMVTGALAEYHAGRAPRYDQAAAVFAAWRTATERAAA